jgi:hypothetical protein
MPSVFSFDCPSFLPTFLRDVESILNLNVDPEFSALQPSIKDGMSSTGQYGRLGRLDSISIIEARTKQLLSFRELKAKIADHVELLRNTTALRRWPHDLCENNCAPQVA